MALNSRRNGMKNGAENGALKSKKNRDKLSLPLVACRFFCAAALLDVAWWRWCKQRNVISFRERKREREKYDQGRREKTRTRKIRGYYIWTGACLVILLCMGRGAKSWSFSYLTAAVAAAACHWKATRGCCDMANMPLVCALGVLFPMQKVRSWGI